MGGDDRARRECTTAQSVSDHPMPRFCVARLNCLLATRLGGSSGVWDRFARSACLMGMGAAERWAHGYGGERAHRLSSQIPAGEVIDRLKSRRALGHRNRCLCLEV